MHGTYNRKETHRDTALQINLSAQQFVKYYEYFISNISVYANCFEPLQVCASEEILYNAL